MKKRKRYWILLFVGIFIQIGLPEQSQATQVQTVETEGSIGFTGIYVPIGTPDPKPPEVIEQPPIQDIAKPGGSLPQTNVETHSWLLWLGVFIISFVFLLWKRKTNQYKKTNQ
ncbi:LPXTG cell wall anchor domain-containing protein [Enterococcus sp. OL5]|uniref:LPXTG cell wall anchor domain-containing protein n=1 Tax=Enterococcus sp. OL5 TaxID=2590214 RepID=UPI00112BC667|nr:LPXTG cell wall anchor domain-containing protein [Enterococcus sp. OL5]TPR55088.1 LPXTG cell wall anchor domain-containing protein [Enterococcus sp. OL5]